MIPATMKKTILILLLSYALTSNGQSPAAVLADFKKLNWLEGTWHRTNTKTGKNAHERWVQTSDTQWNGWGVSMTGSDTVFTEKLKVVLKDGGIYYVADVPDNKELVYFKFTELTEDSFICENPQHDFPKKIAYQRDGNKMKATISGDGKIIDYFFIKR